jgi:hypothetical protein
MNSEETRNELLNTGSSDNQPGEDDINGDSDAESDGPQSGVPQLLPRLRYTGISNIRTIKDGEHHFIHLIFCCKTVSTFVA